MDLIFQTSFVWSDIYDVRVSLIKKIFPNKRYIDILSLKFLDYYIPKKQSLFRKVKDCFKSNKVYDCNECKKYNSVNLFTSYFIKKYKPEYNIQYNLSHSMFNINMDLPDSILIIDRFYYEEQIKIYKKNSEKIYNNQLSVKETFSNSVIQLSSRTIVQQSPRDYYITF